MERSLAVWSLSWLLLVAGCDNSTGAQPVAREPKRTGCSLGATFSQVKAGLLITEIGETRHGYPDWLEIYNASTKPIDLSEYAIETQQRSQEGGWRANKVRLNLAAQVLQPNQYMLIESAYDSAFYTQVVHWSEDLVTPQRMKVKDPSLLLSFGLDAQRGSVSLWHDETMVDAVVFGRGNLEAPASQWQGGAAPAIAHSSRYASLVRLAPYSDTQTSADWAVSPFPTPGAANDVDPFEPSCVDLDFDGIPDCAEAACMTYNGLPYYDWGARPEVQDVFLQVDWMQTADQHLTPVLASMQMVTDAFEQYNATQNPKQPLRLHLDTGGHLAGESTDDPAAFGLPMTDSSVPMGQGRPWMDYASLQSSSPSDTAHVFQYRERYMDVRRQRIFNYALLAEQIDRNNSSVLGVAYVGYYRSLIVGIGAHLNMIDVGSTAGNANYRANIQASTLLHELGHIMHLLHGGDESQNGKPNYVSSMNYLYLYGFPDFEQAADDRYQRAVCRSGTLLRHLSNSVAGSPTQFKMGFSDGLFDDLDENNLDETLGLLRQGESFPYDFDCDSAVAQVNVMQDLNPSSGINFLSRLRDFNDWAEFRRHVDFYRKSGVPSAFGLPPIVDVPMRALPALPACDWKPPVAL
jgi:hypothetical protein